MIAISAFVQPSKQNASKSTSYCHFWNMIFLGSMYWNARIFFLVRNSKSHPFHAALTISVLWRLFENIILAAFLGDLLPVWAAQVHKRQHRESSTKPKEAAEGKQHEPKRGSTGKDLLVWHHEKILQQACPLRDSIQGPLDKGRQLGRWFSWLSYGDVSKLREIPRGYIQH